ncbi:MAG: hypothetical protein ABI430_02260 [Candidatus Taylorbacteria bacterium]
MDTLGKIFGSEAKVRIMRLFLFNAKSAYDIFDVSKRARVEKDVAKKELSALEGIGLFSRKSFVKSFARAVFVGKKKRGKKRKMMIVHTKRKVHGWTLNSRFTYLRELQNLLINTILVKENEILQRFSAIGKVKLVIIAGVFIQNWDSRVDILVVGDKIQKKKLTQAIKSIEAEIGKELQYTYLETQDFKYRMSIYDKLVRDILDYPHEVLFDRTGIKLSF